MSWQLQEHQRRILAAEQGQMVFPTGARAGFALVYPNTYTVGMSNLGYHIIYQQINGRGDTACERLFLPDRKLEQEYRRTNTPLLTLETQRPLYEFELIGFAISFEMDYFNMLNILELGKVPLYAAQRGEQAPLVIAGGPCATFNPEPLAAFVDAFIIGEGEEVIQDLLDTYYQARQDGLPRTQLLQQLAQIPGVYVPCFYEPRYHADNTIEAINHSGTVPAQITRRWVKDLNKYPAETVVVTADTEFRDMYLIEVARGCGRHCRFCMAGYCFRQPRVRSLHNIEQAVARAAQFRDKVGLMGAAISDYPEIDKLCDIILDRGMTLSVASLRADSLTPRLAEALAAGGHKTITLAPEAGSNRLRRIINKGITDDHLRRAVELAIAAGIPNVRLYIMVGLPEETDADIAEIAAMARWIKQLMAALGSKGRLTLSVNPFVPKPFTPFQWLAMTPMTTVDARLKALRTELRHEKNIEVLIESPREAYIQGVLSRGDRKLSAALAAAQALGGAKAWKQAIKQCRIDENFYLYRERQATEVMPWQHLQMGLNVKYLHDEYNNAIQEKFTTPCRPGCRRCGICGRDGVSV